MITLECPHCQSCFTAEDWNKSPHRGDDIPENFEGADEFEGWSSLEGSSSIFDCPQCGDVALVEDMIVV